MASRRLNNYLQSHRKRLALSQDEVAFLMGTRGGGKISRYERFVREPSLRTALAFEIIYKRAISELFDGLYREVEMEIAAQAKILNYRRGQSIKEKAARRRESILALIKE